MLGLPSAFRGAALCGLILAAPSFVPVSASATRLQRRAPAPHIITPSSGGEVSPATITAVSECHTHGTVQYCQAGTTEFRISGTAATASSYTDCHHHGKDTYCMAPTGEVQIIAAQAGSVTPTPTTGAASASSVTAVSSCQMHESELLCVAGTTPYHVHTTVTATQDIPPAFTDCHAHGTETFCVTPEGDDVQITLEGEESESAETPSGENCHFHAGVEHCTGGASEGGQVNCARIEREYNIPLRVGLLFVMLVTSSIGVFTPMLVASFVSPKHAIFTILRQFGTGVIISTAFVHLYTHASLMFQNECLGDLGYESTAAAILMAGIFLSFLVEYLGNRFLQWQEAKSPTGSGSVESASHGHGHAHGHHLSPPSGRADLVNISVLEAGVIFHSLLIGLTLVVSGDAFFLTLFAVIVFHQMFEGLALGTRIAALGKPTSSPSSPTPAPLSDETKVNPTADGESNNSTPSTIPPLATPVSVSTTHKILLATAFALVTPIGMAIGIGVLHRFNGNDPSTVIAIGTLDALSAGILVWVGVVEMWAHDWMLAGGELTRSGPVRTGLGLAALVVGMAVMSLLGKWA